MTATEPGFINNMKFIIVNSFHRDDKGDAALTHVLIDQLLSIDPKADIAVSSMEEPSNYPSFYKGRNIGSIELYSSSQIHPGLSHIFYKVYSFLALFLTAEAGKKFSWVLSKDLAKIYEEYRIADMIISVGGGYFTTKPNFGSRLHLLFALETLMLCKRMGLKVVTAPVSVGPFQYSYEARYASRILKKMDLVMLREDVSKKYFVDKEDNLPENIIRVPDSAFAFNPEGDFDLRGLVKVKPEQKILILSVRNWLLSDKQSVYEKAHADLIDHIAQKYPDILPVFINQCTFPDVSEDDRLVVERIMAMSKSKKAAFIAEDLDYIKVKLAYKQADFVIGTRFHAMVFGLAYQVPGIAIEYEHKTRGIMRDLGLEEWVISISKVTSEKLIQLFGDIVKFREFYKEHLKKIMPGYSHSTDNAVNILLNVLRKRNEVYVPGKISQKINKIISKLYNDSLYRNSFYLILATAVLAGFGFFFWLISAHYISAEQIGIATALISAMNIIAILSLIGFDSAIVRFLWHSTKRNDKLNTAIILVGSAATLLSTAFLLFLPYISPKLEFIRNSPLTLFAFIIFCVMSSINILTDAVFLAYRKTDFSMIINTIFSFVKMLLPLLFVRWGAFGIFSAAAIGQSVGFILSIFAMIWKFDYKPKFVVNMEIVREVWDYCAANYVAGIFNLIPVMLLPIIITNHLGSAQAAYFYIVMMIANLLYVIPQAANRSLFAEGAFDEKSFHKNIDKAVKMIGILLLPAIIIFILGGNFILSFFGKNYSAEGINFFYLVIFSGLSVSMYSLSNSLYRVKKQLTPLIISNAVYAFTILATAYLLLDHGLVGIGLAWFAGNTLACVGYLFYMKEAEYKMIGRGWQYTVYDMGNSRVEKKYNSIFLSYFMMFKDAFRYLRMPDLAFRKYYRETQKIAMNSLEKVMASPLDKNLFGNPKMIGTVGYEQDHLKSLGKYFMEHSADESKDKIDRVVKFCLMLFEHSLAEKYFNIADNFGLDASGNIVLIDLGEIIDSREEISVQIKNRAWSAPDVISEFPEKLRGYFVRSMDNAFANKI